MNTAKARSLLILAAMIATAAHFVRAEGKFLFSESKRSDYVRVESWRGSDKFVFSRCNPESRCEHIGKKEGYTLEQIRVPMMELQTKREQGSLTSSESHELETLQEIVSGIEQPQVSYPGRIYSHHFRVSVEQFSRVVQEKL